MAWLGRLAWAAWALPPSKWDAYCYALAERQGKNVAYHYRVADVMVVAIPGLDFATALEKARWATAWNFQYRLQLLHRRRAGGFQPRITLRGLDHVETARRQGHGAILWVANQAFASLIAKQAGAGAGLEVHHLSAPVHGFSNSPWGIKHLNPICTRIEDRYLAERVPYVNRRPTAAIRRLAYHLLAGRIVSITAGHGVRGAIHLPVLDDHAAYTLTLAPVKLARRTEAPLVPLFIRRHAVDHYEAVFEPPVDVHAQADEAQAIADAMAAYSDLVTDHARQDPTLWRFWGRAASRAAREEEKAESRQAETGEGEGQDGD